VFLKMGDTLRLPLQSPLGGRRGDMRVTNVVYTFNLSSELGSVECARILFWLRKLGKKNGSLKKTLPNFFVLRWAKYTFTVFHMGHVNCSGNKSFEECAASLSCFKKLAGRGARIRRALNWNACRVVNSSWSGAFEGHSCLDIVRMHRTCAAAEDLPFLSTLRSNVFPGVIFRRKPGKRYAESWATCVAFRSGTFVIVGAKTADAAHRTLDEVKTRLLSCLCCRTGGGDSDNTPDRPSAPIISARGRLAGPDMPTL
jgi:TATA-box binding protein (TBP) (component of TFIID and TFIIIB)